MITRFLAVLSLNFIIDFVLLLGTNRICGYALHIGRCIAAAIIGSVYTTMCMLLQLSYLYAMHWRLVVISIVSGVAFGISCSAFQRTCVFFVLSVAMSGIASGLNVQGVTAMVLSIVILLILCVFGFYNTIQGGRLVSVELCYGTKKLAIKALYDSGNTLRDPVTGRPVLIVDANVAKELIGLSAEQLKNPVKSITTAKIPGLRLIPYKTVGQSNGFLLALRISGVKIGKQIKNVLVAFASETFSGDGAYQALTGGVM